MQRDWDLIREILAVLEARDTTHGGGVTGSRRSDGVISE